MDPIHRLDQILLVIGRQMSERASRLEAGAKSSPAATPPRTAKRPPLAALKEKVRERLKAIAADDPRRADEARRVFLESVLSWQFGDELLLDRGFEEIVSGVQEALRAHPRLDGQLARLLSDLSG